MPKPSASGPVATKGIKERLVEALTSQGMLTPADLERAVTLQRECGGSLSQVLTDLKLVDPRVLAGALSRVLRIPMMSLSKMELDPELAKVISRKLALHYQIVPVSRLGNQLTVAMADPMNILAFDHLGPATGLALAPVITTREEIHDALQRLYGSAITDTLEALEGGAASGGQVEIIAETVPGGRQEPLEDLIRLTQEVPVVKVTNAILTHGVTLKASDILVEPFESRLRIRYRVDGMFREGESPPAAMHTGIVSRLKVMATLNIAEHRLPQDGRIKFAVADRDVDFRVSVIPSYYGEKVCLRVLDKSQAMLDIDRLGFDPEPLAVLKAGMTHPHGMVLMTGPTGSGKTTTLYSLLRLVDRPERNLVTVEDPIEYDLPGVNQVAVHPEIGLTFAAALRAILRQDPNVIMIGEIRDSETADIAVKAALTGHLVLSTLHTNDALGAVARLANLGIQPYLIASSVLLVGAQRLPRRVCPSCRQAIRPSKELMEQLALPADGTYVKGVGCARCRNTGLAGRVGLLEAVPMTPILRRLVIDGASAVALRTAACAEGVRSLRDYAVAKVAAGGIPLEEVARTTGGSQD